MDQPISPNDVPRDADLRRKWAQLMLARRGTPMKELAQKHGISLSALWKAMQLPSARAEAIVAEALGLTPQQLFPERFTKQGKRIAVTRPRRQKQAA